MNDDDKLGGCAVLSIMAVVIFLAIPFFFFSAYQEAATFNKFKKESQPTATTWDAIFCELRVTP